MKKTAIYFTHVAAAQKPGFAMLCGHMIDEEDDPSFTRFARAGGSNEWAYVLGDVQGDLIYDLASRASVAVPGGTDFFALGRDGTLRIAETGKAAADSRIPRKDRSGYLEGLCLTDRGSIVVCGSQKEVLEWSDGQWQSIDQGLYAKFNGKNDSTLFAIVESAPGTLVGVGSKGLVVCWSRASWTTLAAPVNLDLHAALPAGDGGVWAAGDGGTLLRLSNDGSTFVDLSDSKVSTSRFDSLALHKGTLYVAAEENLLELPPGGHLQAVRGPFANDSEFHSVSSCGNYLWATGDENVYRLGPQGWESLVCPDNM